MVESINESIHIIDKPYVQELLTILRDKNTCHSSFRRIVEELGYLLGVELSQSLSTEEIIVETPLGVKAEGIKIKDADNIVVIAILRASLPFIWGILRAYPKARLGVIVARRIEERAKTMPDGLVFDIEISYEKIPRITEDTVVIIADPMVATGSTIRVIISKIKKYEPKKIIVVSIIATEYAIKRILEVYNKVEFYTLSIDKELDNRGYIVPGLGDAGDRSFGI